VLEKDDVQVHEDLTIGVGLMRILDSQVKQLKGKEIRTVKILRGNTRDDMGDEGSHEEVVSSPISW